MARKSVSGAGTAAHAAEPAARITATAENTLFIGDRPFKSSSPFPASQRSIGRSYRGIHLGVKQGVLPRNHTLLGLSLAVLHIVHSGVGSVQQGIFRGAILWIESNAD